MIGARERQNEGGDQSRLGTPSFVLVELRRTTPELKPRQLTEPVVSYKKWKQFEGLLKETPGRRIVMRVFAERGDMAFVVGTLDLLPGHRPVLDKRVPGTRSRFMNQIGNVKIDDWLLGTDRCCGMDAVAGIPSAGCCTCHRFGFCKIMMKTQQTENPLNLSDHAAKLCGGGVVCLT